MQDKTETI